MINRTKLAAGLGGLTLMLGTIGGVAVYAATSPAPATAIATEQPGTAESADVPIDPSKVKTTAEQAKAAALAKFPGGTVTQVELQDENGTPVWGVELTDAGGKAQDLKVDGNSGQVITVESDGPDGPEVPGTGETGD